MLDRGFAPHRFDLSDFPAPVKVPAQYLRGIRSRGVPASEEYGRKAAVRFARRHPGAHLVQGLVYVDACESRGHTWVELRIDGQTLVFDGTTGQYYRRADYYRVRGVERNPALLRIIRGGT